MASKIVEKQHRNASLKPAKMDSDGSDDEIVGEDLQAKLERLYMVRDDLFTNLKAVDEGLAELGYTVESRDVKAAKRQAQTGIRIKDKLSFRGREMAAEYFSTLDEDCDGYLNWEDLRAMRSLAEGAADELGFLHEQEYLTWESWRMFMDDAGISTDASGRINVDTFVRLRELMEMRQPLARELALVRMSFLPALLRRWSFINILIGEVLSIRSEARSEDVRGLNYDETQFVLANAGIVFTRPEFFRHMLDRALHEKTMDSLLLRILKRRYASSPSKYTDILASGVIPMRKLEVLIDDIKYTKPSHLLSWLFAQRPQETKKGMYRDLILAKWRSFRFIRYVDHVTRNMFNMAILLRQRKVFEDFLPIQKLSSKENEKLAMQVEVDILGSGGNVDEGMGVEWSMNKLDDTEQYLMRQRLPRDAGFAVFVDFMIRADIKNLQIRKCVEELSAFLKHHYDSELKKNVQFRGIYVLSTKSESDGAQILRIAIAYKRIVSIDAHFEQMLIPYCLNDLISTCTGSFKTSASFSDIMNPSGNFKLDTVLTARFECIVNIRRFVVLGLLRRLFLSLKAGYTEHQVRPDSEDANEIMRRKLRAFFPWIMSTVAHIESWLRGHKNVIVSTEFRVLSDLLARMGKFNPWFRQNLPEKIGSEPGWVSRTYQAFTKYCNSSMREIYTFFKNSMEAKAVAEERARKERLFQVHAVVEEKKDDGKAAVLDKLKRLGIEMDVDDIFAKDAHDAKSMVDTAEDRLFRNDLQGMQMIEKLHETLLGVHTVQIILGKARLNFACSGIDIFEALPKPPQTAKMKNEMEERRKAAMASPTRSSSPDPK